MSEVDLERSVDDNNPPPDDDDVEFDDATGLLLDGTNLNGFDVPSGIFGLN